MKDFTNTEVNIGDTVVFNPPKYKGLAKGKIVKFTPKGVRVEYINDLNYLSGRIANTFLYQGEFVKIAEEIKSENITADSR